MKIYLRNVKNRLLGRAKNPGLDDRNASCIKLIQRALRSSNRGNFRAALKADFSRSLGIKTLFSAAILHTACVYSNMWNNNTCPSATPCKWSTAGNWMGGVPNAAGALAEFPNLSNFIFVNVDITGIIVGTIQFDVSPTFSYSFNGNSLTMQGSAGVANITNNSANSQLIGVPFVLISPLTVTTSTASMGTFLGGISGSPSVTILGPGYTTYSLNSSNTYTGGTFVGNISTAGNLVLASTMPTAGALNIINGSVTCNATNLLPTTGTTTLSSSGTLLLNNSSQSMGPLAGTAGSVTLGTMSSTVLTSNTTTSTTYGGSITGTGGFALAGSGGTLILTGTSNTYQAGTTISGSTLQLGANNALPTPPNAGAVTINSPGVLNLANFNQTIGSLMGNGSVMLGSGTLQIQSLSTFTNPNFSGVISGTGGVTIATTIGNPQVFSGNNNYTGPTILIGGSLQLAVSNALYSGVTPGPVTINGGGETIDMSPAGSTKQTIGTLTGSSGSFITLGSTQLTINETSNSNWGGVISQGGSVILTGTGTLTLTNQNTYTGGTIVNGGVLQLSISNALAPTGNLAINAPGTVSLSNTFTQMIANLNGNGFLQLGSGAALTVDPSASSTFSGNIKGMGSLTVGGPAPLILTGNNSYSGGTTITGTGILQGTTTALQGTIMNAGSLAFNQSFPGTFVGTISGAGSLSINGGPITFNTSQAAGSTTIGSGELIISSPAVLTSPVTIASGAALSGNGQVTGAVNNNGTLLLGLNNFNVVGPYNQNAGSFFNVSLASASSGLLTVTTGGVAITSPATMDITINPGSYAPSAVYTLITDSVAPVTGTFNPPVFFNSFFEGTLLYNQDPSFAGSVQLLLTLAPFSNVITGGNAGAIATCINPSSLPPDSDLLPIINTLIFLPIDQVVDALDQMQPSMLKALSLVEENNLVVIRSSISQRIDDLYKTDCNQCISAMYKWGIWGNFSGDFLRQEGQQQNVGFEATTGAATVGIDWEPANRFFIGLAGAYDYSWMDWNHSRGSGHISSYYAGPYLSWYSRYISLNFSALGSWNNYHTSRHIVFPTVDTHARSNHHGYSGIGHFDLDIMTYPAENMTFSPFGGIDYIYLWENGYTEHDAGPLNMKIHNTHALLVRSELGGKFAKCAMLKHNKWALDFKLSWIHQHLIKGKRLHAEFAEVSCVYTVFGMRPTEDYLDVAAGLSGYFMKDKLSPAIRYEGKFGDGLMDSTIYVQLSYRF